MTDVTSLHQQAIRLINQGRLIDAHPLLVSIINQQPRHADAYFLLGIINLEIGQIHKAKELISRALKLKPDAEYAGYLAKVFSLLGVADKVLALAKVYPADLLSNAAVLDTFGVALSRVGKHDDALTYFEKALSQSKTNPQIHYNYAVSAKFSGLFRQAEEGFEAAIALQPTHYQAHFALSDLGKHRQGGGYIERLQKVQLQLNDSLEGTLHLGHALCKEYELAGDYCQAFESLKRAKAKRAEAIPYSIQRDEELFDYLMEHVPVNTPDSEEADAQSSQSSRRPIFVLGMPRSGTTLVDRILSNHTDVHSAGELQDFGTSVKLLSQTKNDSVLDLDTLKAAETLDSVAIGQQYLKQTAAISGDKKHFIDKLPFNFFYLHLIRKALPQAKIICLLRDPLDTCVGNYRQLFSIRNPHYQYATRLEDLGRFYAGFYHLIKAWQAAAPENFRVVEYEKLVTNPEQEVSSLLAFCELPVQPQCIDIQSNQAPVSTASNVQVRESINTRSIGRWRHYKPYIQPLIDSLIAHNVPL